MNGIGTFLNLLLKRMRGAINMPSSSSLIVHRRHSLFALAVVFVVVFLIMSSVLVSARTKGYPLKIKGVTQAKLESYQTGGEITSVSEATGETETLDTTLQELLGSLPKTVASLPTGYSPRMINSGEDKYCQVRELFTPEEVSDALTDTKVSLTKMAARDTCDQNAGKASGLTILDFGYYTCSATEEKNCTDYFLTTVVDPTSPYPYPQFAKRAIKCHTAQVFAKPIPSKTVFYFNGYVKNKIVLKLQSKKVVYDYDGGTVGKNKLPYVHQAYFFDDGIPTDGKPLKFVKQAGKCDNSVTNVLNIIEQPTAANNYTATVQITSVGTTIVKPKRINACNGPDRYTIMLDRA